MDLPCNSYIANGEFKPLIMSCLQEVKTLKIKLVFKSLAISKLLLHSAFSPETGREKGGEK